MDKFAFMKKVKTESTLSAFVRVEQHSSTHSAEQTGVSSAVSPEITVDDLNIPDPHLPHAEASSSQTLQSSSTKDCLKAETLLAMKTLTCNYSTNSAQGNNELFAAVFPDSDIAKQFQCGKTKCSYLITHRIAPYYHDILLKHLQNPETKYVISFDEPLNKALQEEQWTYRSDSGIVI